MTVSAQDHSVGVGGDVKGDVHSTHVERAFGPTHTGKGDIIIGQPRPPAYDPPDPPDPDGPVPAPGELPPGSRLLFPPNARFTGRQGPLKHLARALLHGDGATLITQAVQGMGGVGKTQLAVEFAHRYGRFFHGVHWINAAQPEAIASEVAACGQRMAAAREAAFPQKLPDQLAWTLAAWRSDGPRLIILDNLEDVETARRWLGELCGGPLRVLLTARRTDWPGDMDLRPLRLKTFTPSESRAFLGKTSEVSETSEVLDALAERLGHLPLALELAGRYLKRHRRKRVADYLKEMEQVMTHRSMQGWREELGNPTGHDLNLMATFALSWEEVEDETARRLFLLAGYCAPNEPIPCELLERAADLGQDQCDEALDRLTGLGLLEPPSPGRGGAGGEVTIHPLLAEYARALPAGERGEGLPALAAVLATMTGEAIDTSLPERFQPLRPHARAVAEWAEAAELEDAGTLWNNLGYHLKMVADYAGARASFERALRIDEAAFG
ncbi:MAG: NB-ARC domain-containing protein, partial [Anaerolineae bacterium]